MDDQIFALTTWVTERGLAGDSEAALLNGFCDRLLATGVPLARANMFIDTLHPIHEGHMFRWSRDGDAIAPREYGRRNESDASEELWEESPFYLLLQNRGSFLRRRVTPDGEGEFPILADLRA